MYFQKILRFVPYTSICFGGCCDYLVVLVYAVFKTFLKHVLESQRAHRGHRIPKCILVRFLSKMVGFWSDFGQIFR